MGKRKNVIGCTKAAHKSIGHAWIEIRLTSKKNLHPYKCPDCHKWHVGHSKSPFHNQSEIDRVVQMDIDKKTLAEMQEWLTTQPVEVIMLMHDFCHVKMTHDPKNVIPSIGILRKRTKAALMAMGNGQSTQPRTGGA